MVKKDGNACLFRLALVILQPLKIGKSFSIAERLEKTPVVRFRAW